MTDTYQPTGVAGVGSAGGSGDVQKFISTSLAGLLTPEGLESNLQVGLRMDSQNHIPLQSLIMHFYGLGVMTDLAQLKAALKSVPNTSISEDSFKVFVNIPSKRTLLLIPGVPAAKVEAVKKQLGQSGVKLAGEEYREKEQSLAVRTGSETEATTLQNWLKTNPVEGLDLKAAVQSESFSAYLKDKYRATAAQLDSFGSAPYTLEAQYQAMMQMMMMSMMNNPQGQLMMMQMLNPNMQFPGQQTTNPRGGNNLFVRKAKGTKGDSQPEPKPKGAQSARQGNYARETKPEKSERNEKQDRKVPVPEKPTAKEESRTRLDSDSFPTLGGKKTIPSEPKTRPKDFTEGKVTRTYLLEYFKQHKDQIKISEKLNKFTDAQVPIIERDPVLRVEEIDPTPKKDFSHKEAGIPSGPNSRKGSMNYRKGSFNKKKGTDDDEYVPKDDK